MEANREFAVDPAELARIKTEVMSSDLYNENLAPTGPEERIWTTYNIAALWIGMAIVITTYIIASGLMAAGMNWWQALLTTSLGNVTPGFTGVFETPTFFDTLYTYGLFFTFFAAGAASLILNLIPGRATAREPGTT